MHKTSEQTNAEQLAETIIQCGLPDIERTMPSLRVALHGTNEESELGKLTQEIRDKAFKGNQYKNSQLRSVKTILGSLILCAFHHHHLALGTRISKGDYLDRLKLNRRHVEAITEALLKAGLCECTRVGFKNEGRPSESKAAQYYPTPKLIRAYCQMLYTTVGDFDDYDPYVFKNGVEPWESDWREKARVIRDYNEFMRDSTWAFKEPTVRRLGEHPMTSGRVYTAYQNITNRRINVREQTLLNGRKVCEVDFSSNHLTMLSMILNRPLPKDPYIEVAQMVGVDRTTVKRIFVPLLGAGSRKAVRNIKWSMHDISNDLIDSVHMAFLKLLPWLDTEKILLNNVGTRMQYLEGEIALKMFQWALDNQIPVLNIHDAYACTSNNGAVVHDAMHNYRDQVIDKWKELIL